jgi:hypothetical protein
MSTNGHMTVAHPDGSTTTDFHLTEATSVVRERTYHRDSDIAYIIGLLRTQAATGTLRIDLSQGGIGSIRFEERKKL